MILKMMDTLSSNYRVFRLPTGPLSLDVISDLKETSTTMSPSQVNTSINTNSNQDAGKQLLDACKIGDLNEIKQLVDNGAPLSSDWLGTSPLHIASQYGHTEAVDILLKAGASRDTRTKVDRTPLHLASLEGHLSIVNLLLSNGAEIDTKDLLKMTPLHWAVERGHYDVVENLLAHGADVTIQSKFDKTPIDIAYDNGRTDMIPLLEKHVHSNRSKNSNQVLSVQNIKTRPTILPNKSNRNSKLVKTPSSTSNNSSLNDNSISSTINNNKSFTIDSIKKIISNSANTKKDVNTSPNKITTRSSSIHNNTATLNMSDAKEALQWLERNGLTSNTTTTTTNGKEDERQTTSSTNKSQSKNNIITIAVNNSNLSQLIKNQSAPFVIINSNELDDKKKVIKIDKVNSPSKANNNSNNNVYSTVESSDLEDLDLTQNERLKQEIQTVKSENKLLKEDMKTIKLELASLKKDLERKEKIIEDFKKKFN